MVISVGVNISHNCSVCVVDGGEVVFCQSEEKLTGIKSTSGFPYHTMRLAHEAFIKGREVTSLVINSQSAAGYVGFVERDFHNIRDGYNMSKDGHFIVKPWREWPEATRRALAPSFDVSDLLGGPKEKTAAGYHDAMMTFLERGTGVSRDRIRLCNHHVTHALTCVPFLPQGSAEPWLIFTLDGVGDEICGTVSIYDHANLRVLASIPKPLSIGLIYLSVTGRLGFKMLEHEYKVMGMAPYGRPEHFKHIAERLEALNWVDDEGIWHGSYATEDEREALIDDIMRHERFDNVCGAVQAHTERMITKWIAAWIAKTGISRIACAGGVFMNVKANGLIAEMDAVQACVVAPSCGDESTALGAAVFGHMTSGTNIPLRPVGGLYLGSGFDAAEVDAALAATDAAARYDVLTPDDPTVEVARLLASGEVVARCVGRTEFGARALGNRSILADPRDSKVVRFINEAVKNRDFWMPFAPSVLAERAAEYVADVDKFSSPHMMFAHRVTPKGATAIAAGLHPQDRTARAQIVHRAHNPGYHALIQAFGDLTGVYALLNTSLNLHGDPMVGGPLDAIRTMDHSGLRYCLLGDKILRKR